MAVNNGEVKGSEGLPSVWRINAAVARYDSLHIQNPKIKR
jgi:hypothetical protein